MCIRSLRCAGRRSSGGVGAARGATFPRTSTPRRAHGPESTDAKSNAASREKRRRADFIVDTSRGLEPARAQVRAILAAIATMPKRR
jgi:hypothetical protein